jgi:hypothetical protein
MQFVRKKKRGVNKKVCRVWFSEEGYRITWRKEVSGVRVPPRFQACVRVVVPNFSGRKGESVQIWDFLFQPRLYRTMKAAEEDCERHRRLWAKACEAKGIRGLTEVFGKLPCVIPLWVRKEMNRKALAILLAPRSRKHAEENECGSPPTGRGSSPDDPARRPDSPISSTGATPAGSIPISTARKAVVATIRQTREVRLKAKRTGEPFVASPAEAPAAGPRRRAPKPIVVRSKPTRRSRNSTAGLSESARKRSKPSHKAESKPVGS